MNLEELSGSSANQILKEFETELSQAQMDYLEKVKDKDAVLSDQRLKTLLSKAEKAEAPADEVFNFSATHNPGILLPEGTSIRITSDPRARWSWVGKPGKKTQQFLRRNSRGQQVMDFDLEFESLDHGKVRLVLSQDRLAYFLGKSFKDMDVVDSSLTDRAIQKIIKGYAKKTFKISGNDLYIVNEGANWSLNIEGASDESRSGRAIAAFNALTEEEKQKIGTDDHTKVYVEYQPQEPNLIGVNTSLTTLGYGVKDLFLEMDNLDVDAKTAKRKARINAQSRMAEYKEYKAMLEAGDITQEEFDHFTK